MKTRATTIKEDMKVSALQFSRCVGQEKVDARDLMDLMPDRQSPWRPQRSITCGQNLSKRIKTYQVDPPC
jgi:hypothetical protein